MGYGAGSKVILAVTDVAVSSSKIDAADTELAALLGPREMNCLAQGYNNQANAAWNAWIFVTSGGTSGGYWSSSTENNSKLYAPPLLYVGQTITSIDCLIAGLTGALGGACFFIHGDPTGTLTVVDLDGVTNAWDTGGVTTTTAYNNATPITVTAGHVYFFYFAAGTNASTHECRIYDASVTAQFGS